MKITEAQNTVTAHVTTSTGTSSAGELDGASEIVDLSPPALPTDRITTEETVSLRTAVAHGVNMAAKARAERVQSLAQAVRAGTYHPMASHLADQILAQAEMEARLAAYLS